MRYIILLLYFISRALFADNTTFTYKSTCTENSKPSIEKERAYNESIKWLKPKYGKNILQRSRNINVMDNQCIMAISAFFNEIGLEKYESIKFDPHYYEQIICTKNKPKNGFVYLKLQPVSFLCNEKGDIMSTDFREIYMTYDYNNEKILGDIKKSGRENLDTQKKNAPPHE